MQLTRDMRTLMPAFGKDKELESISKNVIHSGYSIGRAVRCCSRKQDGCRGTQS